ALVFVGDAMEEVPADLYSASRDLGFPVFLFQENDHPEATRTFREIARLTKGAHCRFDLGAAGAMARRRAQFAEHREVDRTISLDSLAVLEEVLRHFYWRARILEGLGEEGDYDVLDKAWADVGRWAEKVANFRHPKVQAVRLAGDPNAPILPEHMTLDQL